MCAVPLPDVPVEPESDAVWVWELPELVSAGPVDPSFVKYLYELPEPEPTLYVPDAAW